MTERGQLDNKTLRRMREALSSNEELQHSGTTSRVYLDKDKKKSVSLSLKMSALRKIDKLSFLRSTTRSQTVEFLVDNYVEHLIQVALQDKK
ncbi:putative tellurite resistance protein [Proteus mirabilis]|nr:putative tellurium resistance protein TerW [Proteus mirabilis]KGA88942.1 putative tellurite resistance protein [Proteus mirabilis]HEK0658440.1 tellurium resistance protein TerW [Proteus mirabilis]